MCVCFLGGVPVFLIDRDVTIRLRVSSARAPPFRQALTPPTSRFSHVFLLFCFPMCLVFLLSGLSIFPSVSSVSIGIFG